MVDVKIWFRDGTGRKLTNISAAEAGRFVTSVLGADHGTFRLNGFGNGVHTEHDAADVIRIEVQR